MRGLVLLAYLLPVAAMVAGCDDEPAPAQVVQIAVDGAACLGGADEAAEGSCRPRLDEVVGSGAVNGCLVVAREGTAAQHQPLRWANGRLSAAGEAAVDLAPGQTVQAALFLFGDGFDAGRCARGGLTPSTVCGTEPTCVLKLVQRSTALAAGVILDFRDARGACTVEPGLLGSTELCDGLDNDCDGLLDETFPTKGMDCSAGAGACLRSGEFVCNAAADAVECDAEVVGGGEEFCDGLDNDCDGMADNGLPIEACCVLAMPAIGCGQPQANSACLAGTRTCQPIPGVPGPKGSLGPCLDSNGVPVVLPGEGVEVCDELDNDCDGNLDEDLLLPDADQTVDGNQPAPVGAICRVIQGGCAAEGDVACADGQPVCDHPPIARGDEVCDRVDNDCDGQVDEEFEGLGVMCSLGVGACEVAGRTVCGADRGSVVCGAEPGEPLDADLCGNAIDDDCDGRLDEGYDNLGVACTAGNGACRNNGEFICRAGGRGTECSARPRNPMNETCNAIDDDCDGRLDEGFDVQTDVAHCGRCDRACVLGNAVPECVAGECGIDSCLAGFRDLDGRPENGCECNPDELDLPDPTFTDSNCDGVDGVAARALFVSAETGSDATGTGESTAPFRTIARAIDAARTLAQLNNFRDLYLDAGRYDVTLANPDMGALRTGIAVPAGVSIHGGYRYDPGAAGPGDDVWSRGSRQDFPTVITGGQIVLRYTGTVAAGLGRATRLDNLTVETISMGMVGPTPTVGVVAIDVGTDLTIRDVEVIAHDGAPGPAVEAQEGSFTAGRGANGVDGGNMITPGQGGAGGTNVGCRDVIGGRGGNGATNMVAAQAGQISVDAPLNPLAGPGGIVPTGVGDSGMDGDHGDNGRAGGTAGRIDESGRFWISRLSTSGGTGDPGGPGGGGGGGSNQGNLVGGGGGGGGAGGCAGSGGRAAQGGAGSFGIQIIGGTIHLQNVQIQAAGGGTGGAGGLGAPGAPGGLAGLGGLGAGAAANGGAGGVGGRGGCGGHAGGGAGGPSFAVLRVSPTSVAADISRSAIVFEGPDGRALADQGAAARANLVGGAGGPGGVGGTRANCGPPAEDGPGGTADRLGCCANGRGAGNCNALRCE